MSDDSNVEQTAPPAFDDGLIGWRPVRHAAKASNMETDPCMELSNALATSTDKPKKNAFTNQVLLDVYLAYHLCSLSIYSTLSSDAKS